jgi:hypothetical protein
MIGKVKPLMAAVASLVLLACATAPFQSTWRAAGEASVTVTGRPIAALFVSDIEATRRNAEEAMAAEINGRGGLGRTAFSIRETDSGMDRARLFHDLHQAGIEKALVMRAAALEPDAFRIHSRGVSRFGGWWAGPGWGWGMAYDPAFGTIDVLVSIETRFYDVAAERLLWAGVSRFRNPTDIVAIVRRLSAEAFAEMAAEGLIE